MDLSIHDKTIDTDPNSDSNADDAFDADSYSDSDAFGGGRPKGLTIASSMDVKKRISAAMKDAALELEEKQQNAKVTRER